LDEYAQELIIIHRLITAFLKSFESKKVIKV